MTSEDLAVISACLHRYCKPLFFTLFLLASVCSYGQNLSPADYPVVWLRADSTGALNGFWKDATGQGHDASVFGQPVRVNSSLNYNPAFSFNGFNDSLSIPCNVDSMAAVTVIVVFQPADTVETGVWGAGNAMAHKMMMTTRRVMGPDSSVDNIGVNGGYALLSTVIQNWPSTTLLSENAYLLFGSTQNNTRPFKGTIAELLVFDRSLDVLTQIQYETYLAIKYGLPLTRGNYVSAGESVLWNADKNKDFAYRLTGLGREDFFSLHQKQSISAIDPDGLLAISNGQFIATNAANTDTLANGNYLVWGDNNKSFGKSATADGQLQMLNRQWLMNASGTATNSFNTTVQLNQQLLGNSKYWLVVNRGAYAGFPVDSLDYYFPDSIDANGQVRYRNVKWDADQSGKDLFGLAVAKDLLLKLNVVDTPSCVAAQAGSARLQAIGGQSPYVYTVTNAQGEVVSTGKFFNTTSVDVSKLSVGNYRVVLKDNKGHQSLRTLVMPAPAAQRLLIGLEPTQVLPTGGELLLDAAKHITPGDATSYQWTCENGFNAITPQVTVKQPGTYVVKATSKAGCVFSDTVNVTGKALQHIAVYPSPSIDGNFTVSMSFPRSTNVKVGIYDVKGNKVQEMTGKNNTEYRFPGHLVTAGTYTIMVVTKGGVDSRTLLIL
ncbi:MULTISPECIES: T9SS type A sorting domain-containing protein [Niastella]|uniref:T9SS type A sorting domain-containing protein n=1 Tax=Niastella soli TaxID=2821487 RepID=A0ABS3YWW7_9BACT|nr:T9SS type A sorting domain-containing protein [Niastella soli]MBO9202431.1 T9SS type A sorting domain-containing protein [Niastella soli]